MTDHKTEAEQAATNGKYEIAQYHATMYHAEQKRLSNLIYARDIYGPSLARYPSEVLEGLGL